MQWKKTCLQSAYKADKSLQRKHSLKYLGITFDKLPYLISMSQIQLMEQKKKKINCSEDYDRSSNAEAYTSHPV